MADIAIKLTTRNYYSHIELLMTPLVPPTGICISASKRDGGVRTKSITFKPERWDFLYVPDLHGGEMYQRALRFDGMPYNALGAVASLVDLDMGSTKSWFCSELMAYLCEMPRPHRFDPGSFADYHLRHSDATVTKGSDLWPTKTI